MILFGTRFRTSHGAHTMSEAGAFEMFWAEVCPSDGALISTSIFNDGSVQVDDEIFEEIDRDEGRGFDEWIDWNGSGDGYQDDRAQKWLGEWSDRYKL